MNIDPFKSLLFTFAVSTLPVLAAPVSVRLVGNSPARYECNDGTKVTANYYELSDKSLQFVKLHFDKHEVTLPAVVSGSGARYSDSYKTEWWIKGKNATLNKELNNKHQKPIECDQH